MFTCSDFLWEREYFVHFSENIKCGNLNKNRLIYHIKEKRVTILLVFMVILSSKIMQNYPKITPKKWVRVISPHAMVTGNG